MMKVSEILRLLHEDGWHLVATKGSHRQFRRPKKSGRVTVAGRPGEDLAQGTLNSILKQSSLKSHGKSMRYAVVIENVGGNFSAYVPDLPGCVATGATAEDAETAIREAIEFHLEGMRKDGETVPEPKSRVDYVEVAA